MNPLRYSHLCHYHPLQLEEEKRLRVKHFLHDLYEILTVLTILILFPLTFTAERIWRDMRKPKDLS